MDRLMARGYFALLFLLAGCSGAEVDFARSLAVPQPADIVLRSGRIVTMDRDFSIKQAVAIKDDRFLAVGSDREMRLMTGPRTRVVDLGGRTVIPGLIDSHIHATLAGLSWDAELHWEQTRSLADGMKLIANAAQSRPAGSWIVVAGGWVPTQFIERRLPTRNELDAIAPNHPVYLQYLRQAALLNSAALKAMGITGKSAEPAGGKFERDPGGELTGWLQGRPAWESVYDKIPRLTLERMRQSLISCFRELNRLGITSVGDVQGGEVNFAHRRLLADMARAGELTVRLSYFIAPNPAGDELEQLKLAADEIRPLPQSDHFRFAGFADVLIQDVANGDMPSDRKGISTAALVKEKIHRLLQFFAAGGYRFQLGASLDNIARQWLDVIEQVHVVAPFSRQRVSFAHLDDATVETIERIKKLGGGIAVQDRMALTGERDAQLWGETKASNAPPLRAMIDAGIPVGAGTDAFRSGNYSPMLALWWLVTGKTVAGTAIRDKRQNVTRAEALRMYTNGSAWLIGDEGRRGSIEVDKLADLVVLKADYFSVPEDQIPNLESMLTMVGGRVVHFTHPFAPIEIYKR
jgi:predicted amidohydrolase YtcJ